MVFTRGQKSALPAKVSRREEIADAAFHYITQAEVKETGGQGSFEVKILGNEHSGRRPITVRSLSPHASYKPPTAGGDDVNNFEDSQTASAMVTPTPQIGTRGIVAMADKNSTTGFWLGAIIPPGLGQTFPEFGRSDNAVGEQSDLDDLASPVGLPASEINSASFDGRVPRDRARRAVHPFARVLQKQGLLVDTVRGQSTSSFLRDGDTSMIGFNTPGGVGTSRDIVSNPGPGGEASRNARPLTRLGGHTFVMDDGDNEGRNNLVRIRSGKGAQVLMHDTAELVYITNQSGSAWIEMTADGKIDIYAKDSVSIHTEADFNFRADRDINLEAGRNVNLRSIEKTYIEGNQLRVLGKEDGIIDIRGDLDFVSTDMRIGTNDLSISSSNLNISNRINTKIRSGELDLVTQFGMRQSHGTGLEIKTNVLENQVWNAQTYNPGKIYNKGETVIFATEFYQALRTTAQPNTPSVPVPPAPGTFWIKVPPVTPETLHPNFKVDTNLTGPLPGQIQMFSKDAISITSAESTINLKSLTEDINVQTPKTVYIDGTSAVHLNKPGPGAATADQITVSSLATNIPFPFDTNAEGTANVSQIGVFENPITDPSLPWNEGYYASEDTLFSIMKRIPMHEPWALHEGTDKEATSSSRTDIQTSGQ